MSRQKSSPSRQSPSAKKKLQSLLEVPQRISLKHHLAAAPVLSHDESEVLNSADFSSMVKPAAKPEREAP